MHRVTTGLLAAMVLCWASGVAAKPSPTPKSYAKRFDHFTAVIAEVGKRDSTKVVRSDLEQMRTWIGQAQAYLAAEKLDQIPMLLERIAFKADYVRAKVDRVDAEMAADKAEQEAEAAEAEAAEVHAAADAAAERLQQLESEEP